MNITSMPSNPEAEAAVLGSVMCDSDVLADIDLSGDDFYSQANRSIWETMRAMAAERAPSDMVTLSARLKKEDLLDKAWGLEPESRLSCQAIVAETPLVIEIPKYSINMTREGKH